MGMNLLDQDEFENADQIQYEGFEGEGILKFADLFRLFVINKDIEVNSFLERFNFICRHHFSNSSLILWTVYLIDKTIYTCKIYIVLK